MDGTTVFVALMALCGANLAMIWQVSKLTDRVHDVQDEAHAVAMRLIHREARMMREDGDSDGED
ncbi:MAG: hypothetical protein SO057_06225 [Atopobiaceae bacterium]|nr:hypothetical protein [Atopobiaceae bacterium]